MPKDAAPFFKNILADGQKPDIVIAADSGLETLLAYQEYFSGLYDFYPAAVIGDFDSIGDKKILEQFDGRIIERASPHKDLTDTEMALKKARDLAKGQKAFVTLIGGAGGRSDHFLGIFSLFGSKDAPDAWLCGEQVFWRAQKNSFSVGGLKAGDIISIARAFGKNSGGKIISWGLEWESPVFRKKGLPSLSNTIKEEWAKKGKAVQINFKRGSFVLILPLFASVLLDADSKRK